MVGRTVTRAHLRAALYETAGITEHEASALVEDGVGRDHQSARQGRNRQTRLFRDVLDAAKAWADRPQSENRSGGADRAENGCGLPTIADPQGAHPGRIGRKGATWAAARNSLPHGPRRATRPFAAGDAQRRGLRRPQVAAGGQPDVPGELLKSRHVTETLKPGG